MRSIRTPIVETVEDALTKLPKVIAQAKAEWLRRIMERVLPPEIFKLAYSDKGRDTFKVSRYIAGMGIELREHPDKSQCQCVIKINGVDAVLGECRVTTVDGKVTVEARSITPEQWEELKGLQKGDES